MFLKNAKKKDFAYYLRHGGRRQQQVATAAAAAAIAVGPFRPACQSTSTCLLDSEQRDAAVRIAKKNGWPRRAETGTGTYGTGRKPIARVASASAVEW